MSVELRRAAPADACILAKTRRIVWEQTYRGIYPDEMLDGYDLDVYTERDRKRIETPGHYYFLFVDGDSCVGYFSYGPYNFGTYKDFDLCLNNLYILEGYKGMGLGKRAFAQIRAHCEKEGTGKFFCGCNAHNMKARAFYTHMGGVTGDDAEAHADPSDDIIHFEFYLGEKI